MLSKLKSASAAFIIILGSLANASSEKEDTNDSEDSDETEDTDDSDETDDSDDSDETDDSEEESPYITPSFSVLGEDVFVNILEHLDFWDVAKFRWITLSRIYTNPYIYLKNAFHLYFTQCVPDSFDDIYDNDDIRILNYMFRNRMRSTELVFRSVDDSFFKKIWPSHDSIETLTLKYCYEVTDTSLAEIKHIFPSIININMEDCKLITDTGLVNICYPTLQRLNLRGCHQITDKGVFTIASLCPNLTFLSLQGTFSVYHGVYYEWEETIENIFDASLDYLSIMCRHLEHLELHKCHITQKGVQRYLSMNRKLRHLKIVKCDGVRVDFLKKLKDQGFLFDYEFVG